MLCNATIASANIEGGVLKSGGEWWAGVRLVLPLALAIGALGVAFGYLARSAGMPAGAAVAMSAITFAGSPQFAALAVFAAGGTLLAAVAAASALSMRFAAMSATASGTLGNGLIERFLLAQLVVDETWAVAYRGQSGFHRERLVSAGITLYAVHVSSTAVGASVGNFIGSAQSIGVDVMSPALFVILIAPQLKTRAARLTVVLAATVALTAVPFTPPGIPIVLAIMAIVSIAGVLTKRGTTTNATGAGV